MLTNEVEMICDDGGIEVIVAYARETTREIEFGETEATTLVYTELQSVEVVIKGRGIDILNLLTDYQKEFIIENLQPC